MDEGKRKKFSIPNVKKEAQRPLVVALALHQNMIFPRKAGHGERRRRRAARRKAGSAEARSPEVDPNWPYTRLVVWGSSMFVQESKVALHQARHEGKPNPN